MKHGSKAVDNVVTPVTGKMRIQALDVIRGLSILGILAVNADGYAAPQSASLNVETWLFPNEGWTSLSYWLMDTFFHDKFVSLFSMLFGVSLFLVGGEISDRRRSAVLARRLLILFGFGLLHGFGIWWGDILSLYAFTGALMFFCRSWTPRTLLLTGLSLYALMVVRQLPLSMLSFHPHVMTATAHSHGDPAALAGRKAAIASTLIEAKSSWAGAYAVNAREYGRLLSGDPWLIPQTLGLMMIGLGLFKRGFLAGRSDSRRYAAMIAVAVPALGLVGWLCWWADVLEAPLPSSKAAMLALAPLVALGYASALILGLRTRFASVTAPLAATGRMAFTNYLTQSIIMTSIFYGGRGGLMGDINRPGLWGITIVIWALQLIWSPLWLTRYEMGPFEWAWRCLTVGKRIPLRKPDAGGRS